MLLIFGAAPAEAALQKYSLHRTGINQDFDTDPDLSPSCFTRLNHPGDRCEGKALVDVSGPAAILLDFEFVLDNTLTVPIHPSLFFASFRTLEGPTGVTTGSGDTASGSSLRWGTVTGWTITGSWWCHSVPAVICTLAGAMNKETTDPPLTSSFYDLGTWSFHGTGFSSVPFVSSAFTNSSGNYSLAYRGALVSDATIPALPALGIAALGVLLAGGAASALRQREP